MSIEDAYAKAVTIAEQTHSPAIIVLHDAPGDFDAVSQADYRKAQPCALRFFDTLEVQR
jgi:hypothetical protein